jgi:hypothetical protein
MTDPLTEEETSPTYRVDITVYIDAPTEERIDEIVIILENKLLEVPGIRRLEVPGVESLDEED